MIVKVYCFDNSIFINNGGFQLECFKKTEMYYSIELQS